MCAVSTLKSADHTSENDVWRDAHLVMKNYGDEATLVAAMRAEALLADGDTAGCSRWMNISRAIRELRFTPNAGDILH